MPKAKGGNPNLPTGNKQEPVDTLADLGISKRQSSAWQKLAGVGGAIRGSYCRD
jgi:hypothetical protein